MAKEKLGTTVPVEEQPYSIPDNWLWVRGWCWLKKMETRKPAGEVFKYIDIESIDNKRQVVSEAKVVDVAKAPSRASRAVHNGDTVFSTVRPYLKNIAYIDESLADAIASTGFYVCSSKQFVDPKYCYYMMTSAYVVDGLNAFMKGDNSPSIRNEDLENFEYPLPPLPEQRRIVEHIESLFAKLDEAKEKAQAVVDGFEDRKAAILHKAFTGELTSGWRKQNEVTSPWISRKLKDCGTWSGGGTPSMAHPEYWENGDIMWVTSKDMKADVVEDTIMHTNQLGIANSSANYCDKPSVLFVMRSGILRRALPIAMVKVPFSINQDLKALSPDDIDLEYLFWACQSKKNHILSTCMKNGTTVESINTEALLNYEIPVASHEEQFAIVKAISDMMDKENTALDIAQQVISQIDTMKKAILVRAFRGELGTNDPSEPPADIGIS